MSKDEIQLTSTELELMLILWKIKEGNVKDILNELPPDRDLAYTSVSTIIRILEKKGFVSATKVGRGHIYYPIIEKAEYEKFSVHTLVEKVFKGSSISIMKYLIQEEKLSGHEIQELQNLLKDKK